MQLTEIKDIIMMKEMAAQGVFAHKAGSRERGQVWQNIATNLNVLDDFVVVARSVRDRFSVLLKKHKAKTNKELKGTGLGGGEPSEFELLLEDLIEQCDDSDARSETESDAKKAADVKERQKALDIRQTAMERFSETKKRHADQGDEDIPKEKRGRRTSLNAVDFLKEKLVLDKERQQQKSDDKKKEREQQNAQQNEFMNITALQQQQNNELIKTFQQQVQQQAQQQTMIQQQLVTMMNQQQQMFMKLFDNDTK